MGIYLLFFGAIFFSCTWYNVQVSNGGMHPTKLQLGDNNFTIEFIQCTASECVCVFWSRRNYMNKVYDSYFALNWIRNVLMRIPILCVQRDHMHFIYIHFTDVPNDFWLKCFIFLSLFLFLFWWMRAWVHCIRTRGSLLYESCTLLCYAVCV